MPQYSLTGLAEAFNAIGQIEFYYSQFPKSMASIAVALFTLGMGFGNLVGSLILKIVDDRTKHSKVTWLPDNPNQGRYDHYYWLLTLLGFVNLLYYFLCSWAYGSCEERGLWDEEKRQEPTEKVRKEEDLSKSKESIVFAA